MIKTDAMGEYNDEQIPEGITLPFQIDEANEAIVSGDNVILARYAGQTIEQSVLALERRKAEFVVRMANGELMVIKDKKGNDRLFSRTGRTMKGKKLVVEYEEVKAVVPA